MIKANRFCDSVMVLPHARSTKSNAKSTQDNRSSTSICFLNHLFKKSSSCSVNPSHRLSQPLSWIYCSISSLSSTSSGGPNNTPKLSTNAPQDPAIVTSPVIVPMPVPANATPAPTPIAPVITPPTAVVLRTQLLSLHARETSEVNSKFSAVHTATPSTKTVALKVVSVRLSIKITASLKARLLGKPISSNSP